MIVVSISGPRRTQRVRYLNHVDALEEQLRRKPVDPFPTLHFKKDVKNIEDFAYDDFEIRNYKHQGKITMKMAV